MKLGIIVVYLVDEDNEKLLELHLEKIKENTTSPYTVYAGINMLLPKFVNKLKQYNFVKPYNCNNYNGQYEKWRDVEEHSHYLEQLITIAINDGVSHIVILHPDSFPIKIGWEKYLEKKLSGSCVLVSIFPTMSSCMFFNRQFYIQQKPSLLLSKTDRAFPQWIHYQKSIKNISIVGTGIGYGYKTYLEKLGWYILKNTNKGEYHNNFDGIFEDIIFHLGAASKYINRQLAGYGKFSFYRYFRRSVAKILPISLKDKFINILPHKFLYPEIKKNKEAFLKSRDELINNPERYLNMLRNDNNNFD